MVLKREYVKAEGRILEEGGGGERERRHEAGLARYSLHLKYKPRRNECLVYIGAHNGATTLLPFLAASLKLAP